MNRDIASALLQLNTEKNIPREQLVATLADAIQSAYRRATPGNENVFAEVNPDSGRISAFRAMYVVDEVEDPTIEFTLDEARKIDATAKVGDLVKLGDMDEGSFGRIHAQMAQQLFRQRLREVEREQVFGQYAQRESEIVTGTVSTLMPYGAFVNIGGFDGLLHVSDISHARVTKPEDVLTVGQELQVKILKIEDNIEVHCCRIRPYNMAEYRV